MKKNNIQNLITIFVLGMGILFCGYAVTTHIYVHAAEEEQKSDFEIMGELFQSIFEGIDSEEIDPEDEEIDAVDTSREELDDSTGLRSELQGDSDNDTACTGEKIRVPNSRYLRLKQRLGCVKPNMVVIHWTYGWITPETTYQVLNKRGLSCQIASNDHSQLQLLDMYETVIDKGWCVKRHRNGINIEISGDSYDQILAKSPQSYRGKTYADYYDRLMDSTDIALDTTCWALEQYDIPKNQVWGHLELNPEDKTDPGAEYIQYFRQRVREECDERIRNL